ncbi:MAG: hypothetical protein AB4368_14185 [Xenococcaceae cyanobacterium]
MSHQGVVYRSLVEPFPPLQLSVAWCKDNRSPVLKEFLALYHNGMVENK